MSNIPRARDRLNEIAQGLENADLCRDEAASMILSVVKEDLIRRQSRRKAPTQSQPMTDELRATLRQEAKANPGIPQAVLAARFGVNPGRVSEALRSR